MNHRSTRPWLLTALVVGTLMMGPGQAADPQAVVHADGEPDPDQLPTDPTGPVDCLINDEIPALPATPPIVGNGASTYQFFQAPLNGAVFVTWSLATNNINNGANDWMFGAEITHIDEDGFESKPSHMFDDFRFGTCRLVGFAPLSGFNYFVDAGAGGYTGMNSCTEQFDWEVTVGVEVSITGPSGTATGSLGGSIACTEAVSYDSESLLRDAGSGSIICANCLAHTQPSDR